MHLLEYENEIIIQDATYFGEIFNKKKSIRRLDDFLQFGSLEI